MFTPIETSLGALLLHLGSTTLLLNNGRVFGISGFLRGVLTGSYDGAATIIIGLVLGYIPVAMLESSLLPDFPPFEPSWEVFIRTLAAGVFTGWGTKKSTGCTSGHMLCGLSRLSGRSLVAVAIFFSTAVATSLTFSQGLVSVCPDDTPCFRAVYPSFAIGLRLAIYVAMSTLTSILLPRILNALHLAPTISRKIVELACGIQFGSGLLISGMANPVKVLGFFAINRGFQRWDPSLALVIVFGILPNLISYLTFVGKDNQTGQKPTFAPQFRLPPKTISDIDLSFILGATAFGVGWGLSGVCPGPGLARAVLQPDWFAVWLPGFAIGSFLA